MALNISQIVYYIGATPTFDNWAGTGLTFTPDSGYVLSSEKAAILRATGLFLAEQSAANTYTSATVPSAQELGKQIVLVGGIAYVSDGIATGAFPNGFTPVTGAISQQLLIDNAVTGDTSGWLPSLPSPERFMGRLLTATGGAAASITIDGSNDAINSAAQIGAFALDTISVDCITPPLKSIYPYVRMTVVSAGSGTVRLGRGA